jgi:diguanylate cyclase (GGDEF)-like protein
MDEKTRFKIMLMVDDAFNLDMLKGTLSGEYELQTVRSGENVIAQAIEHLPDLILLDVNTPEMNGFDILLKLKEADVTRHIPVIFVACLASAEDEENGLDLGAVDYIARPFNEGVIRARVRAHLQIAEYIRAVEKLSMMDALTDIPNRRHFDIRIREEWRRMIRAQKPISMLMIDVDKFKVYNDTYGHTQGDLLLQSIAKVFSANIKRAPDMVARWGGEEFAVLLPETDLNGALIVAERIRASVEAEIIPCAGMEHGTSVTISTGLVSTIPSLDKSMDAFVEHADKNLYIAKLTGRNKVVS